jgi:uncharacterized protein GlcG (DUF336 family)
MARVNPLVAVMASLSLALAGCGGGGGGAPATTTTPPVTTPYTAPAAESLSVSDVQTVVAQAVAEAKARGTPAVISVTDRVGNVLAVYQMVGAPTSVTIHPGPGAAQLDLQSVVVPATLAAISKAITGAYLSSSGNAFSTRTASEIVQETFPPQPATAGLGSGPLFGVQFSQLPCSDLALKGVILGNNIGPRPAPLGLSADPGGFPLYKNGVVVGGVGVKANTDYGFDPNVNATNAQQVSEEAIAVAATVGYAPPSTITADQITVGGNSLIYTVATTASLMSTPSSAPSFASLGSGAGALVAVPVFYAGGSVLAGQVYGTEASGVRKSTTSEFNNPGAFVLTDGSGSDRYTPKGGTDSPSGAAPLTTAEVTSLLQNAFTIMSTARAQIRNPLNSPAQVTISVVDTNGVPLGIVRAPDAPMFGIDVSLQKARTANFFSNASAASDLTNNTDPGGYGSSVNRAADIRSFVAAVQSFLGVPTALTGQTAFSTRSVAGLARPLFPDGQVSGPPGPLSRPISEFSIFATGIQTALVDSNLMNAVAAVEGAPGAPSLATRCGFTPDEVPGQNRVQNGFQIFAGGEPIYRNGVLVGAIGVSGDGTSQDDMIGFLGINGAATATGTIENAPAAIRADQLIINQGGGTNRVLYINCPVSPFLNSSVQNACAGL